MNEPMGPPERFRLSIVVRIQKIYAGDSYPRGEGLSVEESTELDAGSFLEVASILGRFHDLVQELR